MLQQQTTSQHPEPSANEFQTLDRLHDGDTNEVATFWSVELAC
jgi:hypothetical protein